LRRRDIQTGNAKKINVQTSSLNNIERPALFYQTTLNTMKARSDNFAVRRLPGFGI
jgi:hypothetical protein